MHVDLEVLSQIAFGFIALYLIWDRNNMTDRISHVEQQHNKLCEAVADLAEEFEQEMNELEERLTSK